MQTKNFGDGAKVANNNLFSEVQARLNTQIVCEYIEVDYNRKRRHNALGYLSPEQYELKNIA